MIKKNLFKKFIVNKNKKINIFTPGPAALLNENIINLEPCFGRGDKNYTKLAKRVEKNLKIFLAKKNYLFSRIWKFGL